MSHIFMSYSRKDVWIMRFIKSYFQSNGLQVWVDEGELAPGVPSWQKSIQNAIKEAACLVVLLSPEAAESEWVAKEIEFGKIHDLRIYPILAAGDEKNTAMLSLMGIQRIDIRDHYEQELQKLVTTLRKQLGISQVAKRDAPAGGIRWDRLGSVFWFASDCRLFRVKLLLGLDSAEDIKERLIQIHHHAVRLCVDKDILEEIERIVNLTRDYTDADWDSRKREIYENRLRVAFYKLAGLAEHTDPDFDAGPKWTTGNGEMTQEK